MSKNPKINVVNVNFFHLQTKKKLFSFSSSNLFIFAAMPQRTLYNEHANKKPIPRNNSQLDLMNQYGENDICFSLAEFSKTNFSGNNLGYPPSLLAGK